MLNEDKLNLQIRKFLKLVGITSQREIEKAIREGKKKTIKAKGATCRSQRMTSPRKASKKSSWVGR